MVSLKSRGRRGVRKYKKNITKKRGKKVKKGGDISYYPLKANAPPIWNPLPSENFICLDKHKTCLAFGNLTEDIKTFFNGFGFTDAADYAVTSLKRIGTPSDNGFITQIKYEKQGYNSYAVLKSTLDPGADNLMYEYEVGLYINKVNRLYPCFIETYSLYKYTDPHIWNSFNKNVKIVNKSNLKDTIIKQPTIDYKIACTESQYLAILIQDLKDTKDLNELIYSPRFANDELMAALFQLYIPLAQIMDNFTHYDLHLKNILMYQPDESKYIHFHYYLKADTVVSFKSSYILKIIDYGRCYFNDEESGINSKKIYQNVCAVPECEHCGYDSGFNWLSDIRSDEAVFYHINSKRKNISHDLLPLKSIRQSNLGGNPLQLSRELNNLIKKIVYKDEFGTRENETIGYPHRIYNVDDAAKCIIDEVISVDFHADNEQVNASKSKLGDLHIYMDGTTPMKFIPEGIMVSPEASSASFSVPSSLPSLKMMDPVTQLTPVTPVRPIITQSPMTSNQKTKK